MTMTMTMKARCATAVSMLMVAGFSMAAVKQAPECELDGSQREMTACAAQRWDKVDAEMNRLYKQQMQRLTPVGQDRLRQSQRAWMTYRDKVCLYEAGPRKESGSTWQMQHLLCEASVTQQRSELLKEYIACTEGGCPV